MTEQERKMLAVSRRHVAEVRERKAAERREADPKHGNLIKRLYLAYANTGWIIRESLIEHYEAEDGEIKTRTVKIVRERPATKREIQYFTTGYGRIVKFDSPLEEK